MSRNNTNWYNNKSVLDTKGKERRYENSTHAGLLQFLPFGIEVEHHSFPRSGQSGTTDHKNQQHYIRERGSHPYNLRETWMRGCGMCNKTRFISFLRTPEGPFLKSWLLSTGWSRQWWRWGRGRAWAASECIPHSQSQMIHELPGHSSCFKMDLQRCSLKIFIIMLSVTWTTKQTHTILQFTEIYTARKKCWHNIKYESSSPQIE